MTSLKARIFDKAAELGFCAWGIARADAVPEAGERLREWIAAGHHGEMGWMEARAEQRASPQGLWPEAKSVIALAMSYAPATDPLALAEARDRGRISVYAQGSDYHKVVKKALKAMGRWLADEAGCELKVFVDTAPVMEKPLSAAAGIGWQGKHSNLLSREHGSWLFLGVIYTTLELEPDEPAEPHCGSCTRCIDACPTGAIIAPNLVDARSASPTSPSSMPGRSRMSFARRSATASTAATIAWRSAPGTALPARPRPTRRLRRGPSWSRRRWPICWRSTMLRSASCSPARRSSGSGSTG